MRGGGGGGGGGSARGAGGGGMGQAAHVSTIIIFNGHHIERFSEVFSFSNQIL